MNINKTAARFVIFALFSGTALAASVPFTFTSGDPARASEVNGNFAALVAAVTSLETKVAALEAKGGPHTMASLAGSYEAFEITVDVDATATGGNAGGSGVSGTVILNADGTGQINITTQSRRMRANAEVVTTVTGIDVVMDSTGNYVSDVTPSSRNTNSVTIDVQDVPETTSANVTWSFANGEVTVSDGGGASTFFVVGQLLIQRILSTNGDGQNGLTILARR